MLHRTEASLKILVFVCFSFLDFCLSVCVYVFVFTFLILRGADANARMEASLRITTEGGHGLWMQKLDEQRGKPLGKKAASTILTVKPEWPNALKQQIFDMATGWRNWPLGEGGLTRKKGCWRLF